MRRGQTGRLDGVWGPRPRGPNLTPCFLEQTCLGAGSGPNPGSSLTRFSRRLPSGVRAGLLAVSKNKVRKQASQGHCRQWGRARSGEANLSQAWPPKHAQGRRQGGPRHGEGHEEAPGGGTEVEGCGV